MYYLKKLRYDIEKLDEDNMDLVAKRLVAVGETATRVDIVYLKKELENIQWFVGMFLEILESKTLDISEDEWF